MVEDLALDWISDALSVSFDLRYFSDHLLRLYWVPPVEIVHLEVRVEGLPLLFGLLWISLGRNF